MQACKICGGTLSTGFQVREMMFGTREEFIYAQCAKCNTIQIVTIPAGMEKYYPGNYYSFSSEVVPLRQLPLKKRLFANRRMKRKYKEDENTILRSLKPAGVLPSQNILDIGCGNGALVCSMFNLGFTNIGGVDKFINENYDYGFGVKILKKDLSELKSDSYDLLMMHHVFEHMNNPADELAKCYQLLKKGGCLMIAIPITGKAFEIYKENWVQLDAPRHFFIYSAKSVGLLAGQAGFKLESTVYNSTFFQYWGSELYRQNRPLTNEETGRVNDPAEFFSSEQLDNYKAASQKLNQEKQGDQAIFYLRKA